MNKNLLYIVAGIAIIAIAIYLKKQKDKANTLPPAPSPSPNPNPAPSPNPSPAPAPAPLSSLPVLRKGAASPYNAKLQRGINALLNALPSPLAKPAVLTVDGAFGTATENALTFLTARATVTPSASSNAATFPSDVLAGTVKSNLFSTTAAAQILAFV